MLFSNGAELLSVNETATALNCSRSQVYNLYNDGLLAMMRHNNRLWTKPSEIQDYFARLEKEAKKDRATRASKHRATKRTQSRRRRPAIKDTNRAEPDAGSPASDAA